MQIYKIYNTTLLKILPASAATIKFYDLQQN
jgi:hypothetical protein